MPMGIKNIYTCPKCGHTIGWRRKLNTGFFNQWPCENCGTLLRINYWKRMVLIFLFALLLYLWIRPEVTPLNVSLFAVSYVLGELVVKFFFSSIVEKGPRQKPDSE